MSKLEDKIEAPAALEELAGVAKDASAAPFLAKALPKLMDATAHKDKKVAVGAAAVVEAMMRSLSPYAVRVVMPMLIDSLGSKKKPQAKAHALKMMAGLALAHPEQMAWCLVEALPPALELMTDIKKDVKAAAMEACIALCNTSRNKDVAPFVPEMMAAIESPLTI